MRWKKYVFGLLGALTTACGGLLASDSPTFEVGTPVATEASVPAEDGSSPPQDGGASADTFVSPEASRPDAPAADAYVPCLGPKVLVGSCTTGSGESCNVSYDATLLNSSTCPGGSWVTGGDCLTGRGTPLGGCEYCDRTYWAFGATFDVMSCLSSGGRLLP